MSALAERLGYPGSARLLIVSCDDLGFCHAANVGVYDSLRHGLATSAGLMVPCPWARGATAQYRGEDVGVHFTLNAELDLYRWGPITQAPSLLDGDGGFPRTITDLWDHADVDELRRECRAQVERAILWGFDVSHLTTHLGTLQGKPEFFDVYLELAEEFHLPLRLLDADAQGPVGFPFRDLAQQAGVVFPDHFVSLATTETRSLADLVDRMEPGVTEVALRPAIDTIELQALAPDWDERVAEHRVLVDDPATLRALDEAGVVRIGYRPLRALMREAVGTR
ncbi:MAG: polysaccharide deacetylase family protein [Acidimicrobiales bacterium]